MGGLTNVYGPAKAATFALGFLAAASLFGRLHYATGKRRQQLKWCAYATAVLVSGATVAYTVAETLGVSWLRWPGFALVMAGAVGLPVARAIAILRHNLFDIDLIIDLTLLYGVLTAADTRCQTRQARPIGTPRATPCRRPRDPDGTSEFSAPRKVTSS